MAPEQIILMIMVMGLTLYALLAGADFGAGVWEFNSALQASEAERTMIYRAIGPVWEANHVWLIFILVGLFGAFPPAFGALCRALWIPLLLALAGIVCRGAAFAFGAHSIGSRRQQDAWGALFAIGSTAAPFFLGASVGAIASGRLDVSVDGQFHGDYLTGWINSLSMFNGFFVVGMCAYLAAVYLTREAKMTGDPALAGLWSRRATATGFWLGILALSGLALVAIDAPDLWRSFRERSWPLVALSVMTGFTSAWALRSGRYNTATLAAIGTVSTVIWGWALAQYPRLIPPAVTIESAKGPDTVLWTMVAAIAAGASVLIPSLALLFYLFKSEKHANQN